MSIDGWANPIHDDRPNELLWSRANMTEAIPGVATALTWSFWERGFETANKEIWHRLGLLSKAEANIPQGVRAQDDFVSIFFGRPVVNVDRLRTLFGRMPGGDPDQVELQFLGSVRENAGTQTTKRRWPFLALRAPAQLTRLDRKAAAVRRQTDEWWRRAVATSPSTATAASVALVDALDQFNRIQRVHGLCLMMGQLAFERLSTLCTKAGLTHLALDLAASGDGTAESAMLDDLWEVTSSTRSMDAFVADHGYHGPDEGALHSHSWREDREPLIALVDRYREQGQRKPTTTRARRSAAEAELFGSLPPLRRAIARQTLRLADRAIPRREITKTAFLQAIDAARHAARSLGQHLHGAGRLADPDDIFHLTVAEATSAPLAISLSAIAARAAQRREYLDVQLPTSFVGTPVPSAIASPGARSTGDSAFGGTGASAGTVTGVARVVCTAGDAWELAPGEVLICTQTDPAWVPFFEIAAGVVVEIGGPLSHAAIVAREMGMPCVVGVERATTRISSGDNVTLDGTTGIVMVRR